MRYALILALLTGLCHSSVQAQDTAQTNARTAPADSAATKKTTFTLGALYASNASYYGQTAATALPYLAASGVVQFPFGLYFSGTAYRLLQDSANTISATSATVGFNIPIGKKLTATLAYSHTFYPASSQFLQAANPDNASAELKYAYWLTSGIQADYAFGKTQDLFLTFNTGKQITLGSIARNKDLITLTPAIDIVAGTQRFYRSYVEEKYLQLSKPGLPLPLLPGIPAGRQTVTEEASSFDLLSYNLKVPLAYNRAHYMVEVEYQLSLLSDKALSGAGETRSFLNCSFYYQF
ncbi:hypothetical protein HF329_15545 [Chitinophaga oryzae]|uniref:Uncharacterized protein n=1 Tax=Chitinophaga oryzae TaxID=2725414 RepID=A0AAE7D7S1_9BACT|nr:hypothetical protein [Chitinophaga oryzae]QJB32657.1 hypothetical protein HF329_15545 [Chitinophaga oryzae]